MAADQMQPPAPTTPFAFTCARRNSPKTWRLGPMTGPQLAGVWDTTFGTAQVNSDLSGQMWYHYYQNGQLVYYTFSVPLSVTLNGQNGFKVNVPNPLCSISKLMI